MTPEENLSYHTHGKIDFDLENITEKMDNCGSSIQNLAMSLAFTEKLSKTKNSILFPLPTISTGDNLSKSKKINKSISAQGFDSKLFISATKVEDCPTLKKKLARLEPILDKYKQPIDHVFRDETNNNFKKPYKVKKNKNSYNKILI